MTRRKRVALTDEIVRTAREFIAAWRADPLSHDPWPMQKLLLAVDALDALTPDPIVDSHGAWVEGAPETSVAAAFLITPRTGTVRRHAIAEVSVGMFQGARGLTSRELEHRVRSSRSTTSSAVNWAINAGWLQDSGFRRDATPGCKAIVWELTPAALAKRAEL